MNREMLDNITTETIKLCDDPSEVNMTIIKNNLAIFREMMIAADETITKLVKAVDEFTAKSGLNEVKKGNA
jgi:hypothetical protein